MTTPPSESLRPFSLAVVGGPYANADGSNRQFEILLCTPGEEVRLRPEPRNKHDHNAIAVYSCRGVQIGYLTAERAPLLGNLLGRTQVHAVFQRKTEFGAWIRVAFNGESPDLTEAMLVDHAHSADPQPEFYPDEEWPDDEWPGD